MAEEKINIPTRWTAEAHCAITIYYTEMFPLSQMYS